MSRHRSIRNLNAADILSESYGHDYDDYDDYDDDYELTPEDKAQMDKGKKVVRSVIGPVEEISDKDIENALWNYYYNTEDTITYLLDELHKSKKKTTSQKKSGLNKSTHAKKDLLSNMDHLVNGKRYPSPVNFDANQQNPESRYSLGDKTRTIFTNCVSLNDIWLGHDVKWCSLAQNNLTFAENSICGLQKNFHHSGLLGGADSSKSAQSSLSSLRSQLNSSKTTNEQKHFSDGTNNFDNQSNTKRSSFANFGIHSSGPSLSSLAQLSLKQSTRPSLHSIATNTTSKLESEPFTNSQTSSRLELSSQSPSLSSLAQKSILQSAGRVPLTMLTSKKLDNKSSLQETITPIVSKQSKTLTSEISYFHDSTLPTLSSLGKVVKQEHSQKQQFISPANSVNENKIFDDTEPQPIANDQASETTQSLTENKAYSNIQSFSNPLIAPPSIFAISIFEQLQDNIVPPNNLITFELYTADSNNNGFDFNNLSPDDIALKAQSQRGTGISKASNPVSKETSKSELKGKQPILVSIEDNKDDVEILDEDGDDEKIRSDMKALNLGENVSSNKKVVNQESKLPKTLSKHKRIDVLEEYKKRSADKVALNLVIIGHVDAGKSTLMGHLLYLLGKVNEKTMKKYERESLKIGKSSFAYAWVLDETGEERSRGITMDIAITNFETDHRRFTLLDAPGHRDFIPNMISGAAQADVSVLVVDATTGEFEAGFEANGQTKEHALLVRSLGVQQLVVAINKLDVVDWSQDRYDEIVTKLNPFLNQAGFKKDKVIYIPCSGLTGENLLKRSENILKWYSGPTLVQQIDKFEPPTRLLDKPFRLSVSDFFKGGIGGMGGITVAGKIEAGTIQIGEDVMVIPGGEHGVVKGLKINDESSKWAAAGDSTLMTLTGLDIIQLKIGSILCSESHPVPVTSHFLAQIVVFDVKVPITRGFPIILHRQSLNEPATITKLVAILDKTTGKVTKKNPRCLPKVSTATIEIKLTNRPIPLETYKENKELGRIMLRKGGETVAAGIVIDILSYS